MLELQVDEDAAAALIDANGNGADLNVHVYLRDSDGHRVEVASGNGSVEIPACLHRR